MQNAKTENKTYELKVEKIIAVPKTAVFKAIGEGRLFLNCGASHSTLKIDFKVGGKYKIDFVSYEMSNRGEFLEIVPYDKIVFTWCQNGQESEKPDTTVTVLLKDQSGKTHLTIIHTGFKDQELVDQHRGGWDSGIEDLTTEMLQGRLRIVRLFNMPIEKLYALCNSKADFKKGKVLETVSEKKLVIDIDHTKLTLLFETEEDNQSWLELIHEGLDTESKQMEQRQHWDQLLTQMRS